METAPARTRRRHAANTAARKDAQRSKCTLLLPADTSLKLSVAAHLAGVDRSELAGRLLSDALRHVVVSIRGQSNDSASMAAELNAAGASAA